jgi:predicted ribosomally synthesized peptide with nif11-like leader
LRRAGRAWWLWEWLDEEVLRNADRSAAAGLQREYHLPLLAMSEEQLAALLAKLKDDAGLQEKLKDAADLDAALAIAKEAGFDVSKAAWLRYQANQTLELSDEELEGVAGGGGQTCLGPSADPNRRGRSTWRHDGRDVMFGSIAF